jgi:hypothetical protein
LARNILIKIIEEWQAKSPCLAAPVTLASQGAEKVVYFVIPSESRNLSGF